MESKLSTLKYIQVTSHSELLALFICFSSELKFYLSKSKTT